MLTPFSTTGGKIGYKVNSERAVQFRKWATGMRSNPDYQPGKPCVYVGMTGLDPDVRFDKHKAGIQANRYVQQYGRRLLPELYDLYNPLTYDEARSLEVELGIDLREGGFGVWQA